MAAHVKLSFVRLNAWPAGTRFHVVSNGRIASNGDLIPPLSVDDPLDLDHPLTLQPLDLWPIGKAGAGMEPAGYGLAGQPTNYAPGFGASEGLAAIGEAGLFNDRVEWSTQQDAPHITSVRDGTYKFGVLFLSKYGQPQSEPVSVVSIKVTGRPRPPTELRLVRWNELAGTLEIDWKHSPDLA